jgi:hypothetical protein
MNKQPGEDIKGAEVDQDEADESEGEQADELDELIAPLDGGVLNVPVDTDEETVEQRLKRVAAAEEHQDAERAGTRLGKL